MATDASCDVLILGGGLAGLGLARMLGRRCPQARVIGIDLTAGPPGRKVGESTTEIGAHFLNHRLGLGALLARTQLPKNGLRFWFDDEARSLSFSEASEDGPATFSYWRTYQLEREQLEVDLRRLNAEAGLEHVYGVTDVEVERGEGGALHRVAWRAGDARREVTTRWLVDATGVRSLVGRATGNLVPEERLTHSACWTWFQGAKNPDDCIQGRAARRVNLGPRLLSTNHLLGEGYWVWLIPLASGAFSVGLVYDHTVVLDPPGTQAELVAFLAEHRMARELLSEAEPVGFGVFKNYSYRPQRYLSADRVGWVGASAGFVDVFYSSGIDQIGLGCEYLTDAIARDLSDQPLESERLEAYDHVQRAFYEQSLQYMAGAYRSLASQELSVIRYRRDTHVYWNLHTWPYFSQQATDLELLRARRPLLEEALRRGRVFRRLFDHTCDDLSARGALRRCNRGRHTFNHLGYRNLPYVRFEQQMGHPVDLARSRRALEEIDTGSFLALLDARFDGDRSPVRGLLFEAAHAALFSTSAFPALETLLDGADVEACWAPIFERLTASLRAQLGALGPEVVWSAETHRRALATLAAQSSAPEEVTRRLLAPPPLADFDDLAPSRAETQPEATWTVEHTPWLSEPPVFPSVYQLLGTTWWRDRAGSLASSLLNLGGSTG